MKTSSALKAKEQFYFICKQSIPEWSGIPPLEVLNQCLTMKVGNQRERIKHLISAFHIQDNCGSFLVGERKLFFDRIADNHCRKHNTIRKTTIVQPSV